MSRADIIFRDMCNDIIENGTTTKGQKVRPIWQDTNESAYTIKQFGVCNRYDLRKEFPALTFRKTALKSAMDEILWIYQRKSNNINDLKPHIWDEWADDNGSIGKAYGYQVGINYLHHEEEPSIDLVDNMYNYPSAYIKSKIGKNTKLYLDQMDGVLYELKHNPFSRRILIDLWNTQDLHEMNLQPCAWNITFNVTDEGYEKLILNAVLNQRSQDVLAANNWNVCQYSLLLMMVAQVSNMIPGQLVHMITDAHIYDRHIPLVKELITRETYDAPIVTLDQDIRNFYDFTTDSLHVENYKFGEQIKNIPIAV